MKRFLSICLVFAMLTMLCGCFPTDSEKLVGSWKGEIDCTDIFNAFYMPYVGKSMGPYMAVSQLTINVELTFHKDGTYDFTTDQESKDKIMDIVWEAMRSGFERYLRDLMDFPEDMSFEDIIAMTGISFEDLMVNAESTMLADELAYRIARSGKYYAEDGKLYLSADKNAEIDQSVYVLYTQEKDALTLTECIPSADAGQLAGIQYPIVFAKAGK